MLFGRKSHPLFIATMNRASINQCLAGHLQLDALAYLLDTEGKNDDFIRPLRKRDEVTCA